MINDIKRKYTCLLDEYLKEETKAPTETVTLESIKNLPLPVQKYMKYTGVIGKEKVTSFKMIADGKIKMNINSNWTDIQIEQYNFMREDLVRLFYIKTKVGGIPVYGLHSYTNEDARMLIKVAGIIKVVDKKGKEMRISDTSTLLNDICICAPAALLDNRMEWFTIDDNSVQVIFHTQYCNVTAKLFFNEQGQLINFSTEDRYYIDEKGLYHKTKWSTPLYDYKRINDYMLPVGEAVWNLAEGDYSYCQFTNIKELIYNV